jgi:thiamine pyrophosphate-dependent acetolactate synthase large subunit-like protein
MNDIGQGPGAIERPALANETGDYWGSDVMALMLREIGLPFVALNPGASYRGLHDSLVNLLGNQAPQMLLCLHEEHAVAIAHGYAKVTGKPMGAIVHSNVGLMHATMAVFNAWCDRTPLVLLGATGPVAADKRRPWIDWIHTASDQGALIRNYTKWDNQPASVGAVPESLLRAHKMATTPPCGPVYVCFDAALQETRIGDLPPLPSAERARRPHPVAPDPAAAKEAAELLLAARNPVILMGRTSRDEADWQRRLKLAEALGGVVLTDPKTGATFPTAHKLQGPPAGANPSAEACALLRDADVVLSLDWVDLGGALKTAWDGGEVKSKVILASLDHQLHNGWSMDYQGLPPVDLHLAVEPDIAVAALLPLLRARVPGWAERKESAVATDESGPSAPPDVITPVSLAAGLRDAVGGRQTCLIRTPLAWGGHVWETNHPLDLLGGDGGGGIGGGPGMAVGAALALRGSGRLPIAVLGDGDCLMGITALWTAVHYRIPVLIIVANNNSFFNDELHQDRMARQRNRPVANRWIGQRIADPEPDIATLARGQGATGFGPVRDPGELVRTLRQAIETVEGGGVALVDVRVEPGYATGMGSAIARRG